MSFKPPTPNKILEMDHEHLREIDGVVLDLESYARHIAAAPKAHPPHPPAPETAQTVQDEHVHPAPVFAVNPVHVGWYEAPEPEAVPYPIMAGAVAPSGDFAFIQPPHTGSGSYSSSFATSYLTSWMTSYRYGSGSWISSYFLSAGSWLTSGQSGSGFEGSGVFAPGGFGLELI